MQKIKSQISKNCNSKVNQQEILNTFNVAVNKKLKEKNRSSETTRINSFNEWLGGLMDADGCFYFSKQNYLSCEINVSSRELIALYKIKKIYGGSIKKRKNLKCYRWRLHKKSLLINFLKALNGNIYIKKEKYKKAISIYIPELSLIQKSFKESGAWFSGFMEGDGTFLLQNNKTFTIFISVPQKHKEILVEIKNMFNGEIYYDESWNGYNWRVFNKEDLFQLFLYFTRYPLLSLKNSDITTLKRFYRWKLMHYHKDKEKEKKLLHLLYLFKKRKKI